MGRKKTFCNETSSKLRDYEKSDLINHYIFELTEKRGTLSVDPKSTIVKSNASDSDRVAAMKTAKSDATGLKDGQSEHEQQQLSAFLQVHMIF